MINSISNTASLASAYSHKSPHPPQPAKPKNAPPQDTVKLSKEAKAAAGDPDHDGD